MELLVQDTLGQVRVPTASDCVDEREAHIFGVVRLIRRHHVRGPVPEDAQGDPHDDVVGVVCATDVVAIHAADGFLAHEDGGVVGCQVALAGADAVDDGCGFLLEEGDDFVGELAGGDGGLHARVHVLAGGVDEGFAEDGFGADAVGEGEPGCGVVGDGFEEVLAGCEEGGFDWFGDYVDLEKLVSHCLCICREWACTHAIKVLSD